ncbi:replicative DNA helicase [Acinetobacter beijerinckii]|uniref:replicative DNA helicase n=1 Tax=Acinetobacter beijerinckii TaxID=262668 RepID=UPI003AF52167
MIKHDSNLYEIQIEQCVLVAIMTVATSYDVIAHDLDVNCFYPQRHQEIYKAIVDLANENHPYDLVSVATKLGDKNLLEFIGGEQYLLDINADAPSSFYNLDAYIDRLKKLKAHRQVESLGKRIEALAQDRTITDIYAEAEALFGQSDSDHEQDLGASFEEAIESAIHQMVEKAELRASNKIVGVKFNLKHLDALIGTIQKGHLCILGGRPGTGKSTLAQMVALDTAASGKAVLFISAEMDRETVANRLMSSLGHIPYDDLHNAKITDGIYKTIVDTKERYKKLPIRIEPKQKPTIGEVRSYARRAKRRYKELGCIIVDYLQLLRDPSKKERIHEVGAISRELKAMAKEFECPVIALVQLNRESENGKKPKASDIKESGQIEQDADQIILVNTLRDESDETKPLGMTELIVAKNRHGHKGSVRVFDQLDLCRFRTAEVRNNE